MLAVGHPIVLLLLAQVREEVMGGKYTVRYYEWK
jgi:hypothetical protein